MCGKPSIGTGRALKVTFGAAPAEPTLIAIAPSSPTERPAALPSVSVLKALRNAARSYEPARVRVSADPRLGALGVVDRPREPLHELGGGVVGAQVNRAHILFDEDGRSSGAPLGIGGDDDPWHG